MKPFWCKSYHTSTMEVHLHHIYLLLCMYVCVTSYYLLVCMYVCICMCFYKKIKLINGLYQNDCNNNHFGVFKTNNHFEFLKIIFMSSLTFFLVHVWYILSDFLRKQWGYSCWEEYNHTIQREKKEEIWHGCYIS